MDDLMPMLDFPSDQPSRETLAVIALKQWIRDHPEPRGGKVSKTIKVDIALDGQMQKILADHGITLTDFLVTHMRRSLPSLQQAVPTDVPGYDLDKRIESGAKRRDHRRRRERLEKRDRVHERFDRRP